MRSVDFFACRVFGIPSGSVRDVCVILERRINTKRFKLIYFFVGIWYDYTECRQFAYLTIKYLLSDSIRFMFS